MCYSEEKLKKGGKMNQKSSVDPKDVEENKALAIIAYLGPLCLVPLLAKKDSPYAQYHAKQGFVLFIAEVALWIIWWFLTFATLGLGVVLSWIVWLLTLIWSILGIVKATQGKTEPLPIIGQFADKFKI